MALMGIDQVAKASPLSQEVWLRLALLAWGGHRLPRKVPALLKRGGGLPAGLLNTGLG